MPRPWIPDDEDLAIEEQLEHEAREEARLDRLLAGLCEAKVLPEDLDELVENIGFAANFKLGWDPGSPWHKLDRFDAMRCVTGGMGLVIHAYDPELERDVAIKFWMKSGEQAQEALLAEAKILARLSHRNVVTVFETGRWGERVYFVMEWIDGEDGQRWLDSPRSWQEVRDVFVEAGRGLAAAHDAGIQHRDFKPANMLVGEDGRVVVADFGIADSLRDALAEGDPPSTPAGTPTYMAPERIRGARGDALSDQFSFCVALWRGLYGARPFQGDTGEALLEAMARGELRTGVGAAVPGWLSRLVRKGLALDPSERHRDMHELVDALLDAPPGGQRRGDAMWDLGGPGDVDERMLNRPEGGWRPAPGVFVGSMLLVCLATLGANTVWRGGGDRVVESRQVESRQVESRQPVTNAEVTAVAESPCAGVAAGVSVDPVVLEVCRLIRGGNVDAADMLFEREFDARRVESERTPDLTLGEDARIVAETLLEYAEGLDVDPAKRESAKIRGRVWATAADTLMATDDGD